MKNRLNRCVIVAVLLAMWTVPAFAQDNDQNELDSILGNPPVDSNTPAPAAQTPRKRAQKVQAPSPTKAPEASTGTASATTATVAPTAPSPAKPSIQSASDNNEISEIIVTAQRKSQKLQNVPIAVNVLTGDSLVNKGINNTESLVNAVPGLEFSKVGAAGTPYLRGVGSSAADPNDEPSVAMYVDGVYIAAPFANYLNFNNIQRVEVLKGPQGTLFGRNATGGVIQIITRDPQHDPSGNVQIGYDNYQTTTASMYATGGLSDDLAADIAFQASDQGKGWGRNLTLNTDTHKTRNIGFRSKLLFTPSDATKITLAGDYYYSNGSDNDVKLAAGIPGSPPGKYNTTTNDTLNGIGPSKLRLSTGGVSLHVDQDLSWANFVSISSFRKAGALLQYDTDGVPAANLNVDFRLRQRDMTQEFQLLSEPESPIDWIVGAFLYQNKAAYAPAELQGALTGGTVVDYASQQTTHSGSVYAQSTEDVFDDTKLTTGVRFTTEGQNFVSAVNGSAAPKQNHEFNKFTWRVSLDHRFTDDLHSYISYNRGIKSGGFDLLNAGGAGYKPEQLDAYELGVKSYFFDRRLRLNGAAFFYNYKDIQVQTLASGTALTTNAASALVKGIDLDFEVKPLDRLTISGGLELLNGKYKNFENVPIFSPTGTASVANASGNDTVRSPKLSANLGVDYLIPAPALNGNFDLSVAASHNSGYFYSAENRLRQKQYTLVNSSITWTSLNEIYHVSLYAQNLTDHYYFQQADESGYGDVVVPAPPRTFGITFRVNF